MGHLTVWIIGAAIAASPSGEAPKLALTLSVNGDAAGLEAFLLERTLQTWENAEVLDEIHETDELLTFFRVAIDWLSANQVSILVEQDGQPLTDRTIEVADPTQAKLTLWLLLKSTINRGLKQAQIRRAISPAPPGGWDFSEGEGGAALSDTDQSAGDPTAAAIVDTDATPLLSPDPVEVTPMVNRSAEIVAPAVGEPVVAATAWGIMPTIWLETPKLFAVGFYGTFNFYWSHLALALQLGYRYTHGAQGAHGLRVHGVPLTGLAGFEIGEQVRAALGLVLSGELKIPNVRNRFGFDFGAEGGLYAQARVPIGDQRYFTLRVAMTWRMTRAEYRFYDSGGVDRTTRERPWTQTVSTGVEWR